MRFETQQKSISDKDTIVAVVLAFTIMVALAYSTPGSAWTPVKAVIVGVIAASCLALATERMLVIGAALVVISFRSCVGAALSSGHRLALLGLAIAFGLAGFLFVNVSLRGGR